MVCEHITVPCKRSHKRKSPTTPLASASDTHLLPLILLQKKIVRVINFSPYLTHTTDILLTQYPPI